MQSMLLVAVRKIHVKKIDAMKKTETKMNLAKIKSFTGKNTVSISI